MNATSRTPPRQVPWRWLRKWLFESIPARMGAWSMLITLPIFLIALGLCLWFYPGRPDDDLIRARGESVPGKIVRATVDERTTVGDGADKRHPITVVYSYRAGGAERMDELETLEQMAAELRPGMPVTVRHCAGKSHIEGLARYAFPWLLLLAVLGMQLPVYLLLMLPGYLGMRTRWRCHRDGVFTKAKLTSVEGLSGGYSRTSLFGVLGSSSATAGGYKVSYVFHGPTGEKIAGQATTTDILFAKDKKAGDEIDILVLTGSERVNCLPAPELLVNLILESV